ncbi:MAG: MATE family efflux transporter [Muribaculaceae bacterium]|nr:MATE family efflux transporter [Muribaculaceae bacterium]
MKAVDKSILAIALPAIVSNITVPVLGLVDVAIVGHFDDAAFIGAIAVGATMFNMLYWLFGFLRMGTAGLTAQAYGAQNRHSGDATLARALLIAAFGAALLIILAGPLGTVLINFLDADDAVTPPARRYFLICIWGAPAVLGTYVLNGWFLGMHNTRLPMIIAIITDVVNIIVSISLVFGAGMRLEGVAAGTVTAQWIGFITGLTVLLRRYRPGLASLHIILDSKAIKRLFSINVDIFLRTLCLVAVTMWFTRAGASQGVIILAANALLMQLFMFFSYFSDGFGYAGEALAGAAYGARDHSRLVEVTRALLRWGAGISIAFSLIYFIAGDTVLTLLTDDIPVINAAREYLPWAVGIPLCGVMAFIYDGIYIGLTLTRRMLMSIVLSAVIFFGLYAALFPVMGNHGLWLAFIVYLLVRGIYLALMLHRDSGRLSQQG